MFTKYLLTSLALSLVQDLLSLNKMLHLIFKAFLKKKTSPIASPTDWCHYILSQDVWSEVLGASLHDILGKMYTNKYIAKIRAA